MSKKNFSFVDIFCGCGGMSLGFSRKMVHLMGIDVDEDFLETYRNNIGETMCGDLTNDEIIDLFVMRIKKKMKVLENNHLVLVGGPPCQAFSTSGYRDPSDPRAFLYKKYLEIIKKLNPSAFVFENVPGLINMLAIDNNNEDIMKRARRIRRVNELIRSRNQNKSSDENEHELSELSRTIKEDKKILNDSMFLLIDKIEDEMKSMNYHVHHQILLSDDYAVPQTRRRLFIFGFRKDVFKEKPISMRTIDGRRVTVKDALFDLYDKQENHINNHVFVHHSEDVVNRISKLKPGESLYSNFSESWKRLEENKPSPTVKENHSGLLIHPVNNRCISQREMARLQSFPDDFTFCCKNKEKSSKILKMIGNAVPPLVAERIADYIINSFNMT